MSDRRRITVQLLFEQRWKNKTRSSSLQSMSYFQLPLWDNHNAPGKKWFYAG